MNEDYFIRNMLSEKFERGYSYDKELEKRSAKESIVANLIVSALFVIFCFLTISLFSSFISVAKAEGEECQRVQKAGWSSEASWWIQRGFDISDCDTEFVVMMEAENGMWDYKRQSEVIRNGRQEESFGFCQIHKPSYPEIVNDPRFFTSQEWQLGECLRLWREDQKQFYGYTNKTKRERARGNLIFEKE